MESENFQLWAKCTTSEKRKEGERDKRKERESGREGEKRREGKGGSGRKSRTCRWEKRVPRDLMAAHLLKSQRRLGSFTEIHLISIS